MEKRKVLKSKKFLAVIAIALMLCLIGGMGAMTYSKYVTTNESGSQSATAAKWGYVINISSDNLFGSDYKKGDAESLATVVESGNGVAVRASADSKVVAPGTSGSITITITGSAEVLAQLKIVAEIESEISCGDYKPVKWTISEDGASAEDMNFVDNKCEKTEKLSATGSSSKTYTISWKWEFEGNNTKDTLIGYKANGTTYENLPEEFINPDISSEYSAISTSLKFKLTATVEQIQE